MSNTSPRHLGGPSIASNIISANAAGASSPQHSTADAVSCDLSTDEWMLLDEVGYEPCGLVTGAAVFHIGLVGVRRGNCEIEILSSALLGAREATTKRLREDAERVGALGVVGVRLRIEAFEDKSHLVRVVAIGTGIRPKAGTKDTESVFLSDLSGQGFSVLAKGGYLPVGLVMGVCVYHVARQRPLTWLANQPRNLELDGYTQALYEARELAMRRLQDEAVQVGADGVVGVTTSESSHVWGNHVIEFFAVGTAIREVAEARALGPRFALSLRDAVVLTDPAAVVGGSAAEQGDGR
jgi:uncharacterized protein YbjQ (UPF0145 family)